MEEKARHVSWDLSLFPRISGTKYRDLGELKKKKNGSLSLTFLEVRHTKSRCQQGRFLLEAVRENLRQASPQLLVAASNSWYSLAYKCITPMFLCLYGHMHSSLSLLCLHMGTSRCIVGVTHPNPG